MKLEIFRKIDQFSDERLKELYKLVIEQGDLEVDFWTILSEAEKKDIEEGIKALEQGRKKELSKVLEKYN